MILNNTAVVFSACHDDEHLIHHFIEYYKSLGICYFACIISYYAHGLSNDEEITELQNLEKFYLNFTKKYPDIVVEYLGKKENDRRTDVWLNMLKKMTESIEYVIPADSDELHEFYTSEENVKKQYLTQNCFVPNKDFLNFLKYFKENNLDYIQGNSLERVSICGGIPKVQKDINLFEQFQKHNKHLFVQPKISLIKKEYVFLLPLGAHSLNKDIIEKYNLKCRRLSITHHFRWNAEGVLRVKKWFERYTSKDWKGWKGADIARKKLAALEGNLLTYK